MADTPPSLSTLVANVERLLLHGDDGMLETCYFSLRFGRDTGYLVVRSCRTQNETPCFLKDRVAWLFCRDHAAVSPNEPRVTVSDAGPLAGIETFHIAGPIRGTNTSSFRSGSVTRRRMASFIARLAPLDTLRFGR
jgi:hypothetical protein